MTPTTIIRLYYIGCALFLIAFWSGVILLAILPVEHPDTTTWIDNHSEITK